MRRRVNRIAFGHLPDSRFALDHDTNIRVASLMQHAAGDISGSRTDIDVLHLGPIIIPNPPLLCPEVFRFAQRGQCPACQRIDQLTWRRASRQARKKNRRRPLGWAAAFAPKHLA
jgi:hypothetical protein